MAGQSLSIGDIVIRDTALDGIVITKITGLFTKPETRQVDKVRPREDGESFGTDRLSGRLITITGSINASNPGQARALWAKLNTAWDAVKIRSTSGAYAPLTMQLWGSDPWTVWGRPRDLAETDDGLDSIINGRIDWVGTFKALDHRFYAPEQTVNVPLRVATRGGILWPVTWPVVWSQRPTTAAGQITVGGDEDCYPSVTFFGPIGNPRIELTDAWSMELAMTIAEDRFVTIDTAPWHRGIWLDGSISIPGTLTSTSRWPKSARIPPGPAQVILRGTDTTGTASMNVSWRDCATSLA